VVFLLNDAADQGAQLVVSRRFFSHAIRKAWNSALRLGMCSAEGRRGLYVVIGVIEREIGTLYCTVLFFGPG
jgi:nitrilase